MERAQRVGDGPCQGDQLMWTNIFFCFCFGSSGGASEDQLGGLGKDTAGHW